MGVGRYLSYLDLDHREPKYGCFIAHSPLKLLSLFYYLPIRITLVFTRHDLNNLKFIYQHHWKKRLSDGVMQRKITLLISNTNLIYITLPCRPSNIQETWFNILVAKKILTTHLRIRKIVWFRSCSKNLWGDITMKGIWCQSTNWSFILYQE